ncbi:hypothetical protein ACQPYE_01060 [Actinosynnema sp. CA-299493]
MTRTSSSQDYVLVADNGYAIYSGPWGGPVVDAWRKTLTEVDVDAARRLRRVARLRENYESRPISAAYRDPEGRYVLVEPPAVEHGRVFLLGGCVGRTSHPAAERPVPRLRPYQPSPTS